MGGEVADAINAECKAGGSAGRADLRSMDLGSLASIRAFVKDIEPLVKEKGGIDFLICNAGCVDDLGFVSCFLSI